MTVNHKELIYSLLLVIACVHGFTSKSFYGKFYAIVADLMYLVTGFLGVALSATSNSDLNNIYKHAFFASQTAGLDLFMVDICIMCGVDHKMALINIVPPIIDIIMKYISDENWHLITPSTHIISLLLLCYLGFKKGHYVLFLAALGFSLAIARHWNQSGERIAISHAYNAIGVFFVGWSLIGKDLNELGVPVP